MNYDGDAASVARDNNSKHTPRKLRFPFSSQTAHCLLVDLTGDAVTLDALYAISDGVVNFFSVACGMRSGPSRVPYFCLLALAPYAEVFFPMQRVTKLSYQKIEAAMTELRRNALRATAGADRRAYEHAVRDAIAQFQKIKQAAGSMTKLEVTLITCQTANCIRQALLEALPKVNLAKLHHVEAMCVAGATTASGGQASDDDGVPRSGDDATTVDVTGIFHVSTIECEAACVEIGLRRWLRDNSTDCEHLHLLFPPGGGDNQPPLTIKCDVQERVVNLAELPFRRCMEATTEGFEQSGLPRTTPRPSDGVPILRMRVARRLSQQAVCESVVFGRPCLLSGSACWQMDWDELERNQDRFNALCHALCAGAQCLVCENVTESERKRPLGGARNPAGLFLVMAPPGVSTLLLKSLASRELLMETSLPPRPDRDALSTDALREMDQALGSLRLEDVFNPLLTDIGLVPSLRAMLRGGGGASMPNRANFVQTGASGQYGQQRCPPVNSVQAMKRNAQASGEEQGFGQEELPRRAPAKPTFRNANVGIKRKKTVTFPDFPDP